MSVPTRNPAEPMPPTEPTLDWLISDTRAQLDNAALVLGEGGLIDIQALAPRIQRICEAAVAQQRRDVAPLLLELMQVLDTLETLLRDTIAKGTGISENTPRRAAQAYRSAADAAEEMPPVPTTDPTP